MSNPKTIIYFYHVPKCGGTFIRKMLHGYAECFNGCFENFTDLTALNKFQENENKLISFLNGMLDLQAEYIFIHHHHRFGGMDRLSPIIKNIKDEIISQGHRFFIFTQVRQPLSFHLSQMNYLAKTGDYNYQVAKPYLDNKINHNFISKYLLYNHPSSWKNRQDQLNISQDILIKKIQVFDNIFILEKIDDTVSALNEFLGINELSVREKVNVGHYTIVPTEKEKHEIERFSALDNYLYEQVQKKSWKNTRGTLEKRFDT